MGSLQNWCKYVALAIVCCISNKHINFALNTFEKFAKRVMLSVRFNHLETAMKVEYSLDQIHIYKQVHVSSHNSSF